MKNKALFLLIVSMCLVGCAKTEPGTSISTSEGPISSETTSSSSEEVHEHTFLDHPRVEPTCLREGNIAYAECTTCGKLFLPDHETEITETDYKLDKLPHQFVDHDPVEATCQHAGNTAYSTCSSCGHTFDIEHDHEITENTYIIPQKPHNLAHYDAVLFDHIEYWECTMCLQKFADENAQYPITDVEDNQVSKIWPQNVQNYLAAETEAAQIEALSHTETYNDQIAPTITWNGNLGKAPYRVEVSETETFDSYKTISDCWAAYAVVSPTVIPGERYYYRVFDKNNLEIVKLGGFKVDDTFSVRLLKIDGVSNVRDAGGWTAKGGNKVLYNKLIRGARLLNITDEGKDVFFNDLHIKTDLDIRIDGTKQLDDDRLNYVKHGMNQYTMLVPNYVSPEIQGHPAGTRYGYDSTTPLALKGIFEALADESNYPIYYHCNAGADRTGSLSYLINGLLGVSYEDLVKDFELTTFSAQGDRYRSGVENGHFVTEGELAGIGQCDKYNYVAFGKLHELISTNYAQPNGELCSAIEYYLKKVCEISDETIQAVRRILLGKEVEFDPVEVVPEELDPNFTMENGNWTLNSQIAYEKGTYFGSEAYKFTTIQFTQDHYISNNLSLILDEQYTKFHFEVYVPSECAKWNTHQGQDTGARFHLSIKPTGGSTNNIQFSDAIASSSENRYYHLDIDAWNTYEIDISSYTDLERFAFYMPYGMESCPGIMYLRNTYVYTPEPEPEQPLDPNFNMTNGNWTLANEISHEHGTFFESECDKFVTTGSRFDHYIHHNLDVMLCRDYTKFHFEVYVPSESAKWRTHLGEDAGERFLISAKIASGNTKQILFSDSIASSSLNRHYHLDMDTWNTFELDLSEELYPTLERFAIYLPYGTAEVPAIMYLRNVHVE